MFTPNAQRLLICLCLILLIISRPYVFRALAFLLFFVLLDIPMNDPIAALLTFPHMNMLYAFILDHQGFWSLLFMTISMYSLALVRIVIFSRLPFILWVPMGYGLKKLWSGPQSYLIGMCILPLSPLLWTSGTLPYFGRRKLLRTHAQRHP